MAKTEETLIIEDVLYQNLFGSNPCLAREYGTKEVTVTLLKEKKVKEIVDFLSYNAKKDEFRCYEIKVSMADFKSKAAKTWMCFSYVCKSRTIMFIHITSLPYL